MLYSRTSVLCRKERERLQQPRHRRGNHIGMSVDHRRGRVRLRSSVWIRSLENLPVRTKVAITNGGPRDNRCVKVCGRPPGETCSCAEPMRVAASDVQQR